MTTTRGRPGVRAFTCSGVGAAQRPMFGRSGVPRRGQWHSLLLTVGCLLSLASCGAARAQSFEPPVPTERVLVLLDREGNVRFTLSSYYTAWENPFRVSVSTSSGLLNRTVTRHFKLTASTPASPLFEGTYQVNRNWGV